jgi:hypothetical protein
VLTDVPLSEAVTCVVPALNACTVTSEEMAPAGMVKLAGSVATAGSALKRLTVVGALWAAFRAKAMAPAAPCCRGSGLGRIVTTAAGAAATCTPAVRDVSFTLAAIRASPAAIAVAVKLAALVPCGTETLAGTWSTPGSLEASCTTVEVACAALRRTVKPLVVPGAIAACGGSTAITVAGDGTTLIPADALAPFSMAVTPAWP